MRKLLLAVGLLCLVSSFVPAFAQTNLGRIIGALTDQTGAAIQGATVTVTDVQRGASRALTTDNAGTFVAPGLIPGTYTVRAEASGFTTTERRDVLVQVGQDTRVDLSLQVGAQTQVVTVTEEVPLMNVSNATLGGVLETQTLAELPVSGRNYLFLLQTRPGIQTTPGGGANSYNTSGIRQSGQNYMFDGMFNTNINTGALVTGGTNTAGGPDQANLVPLDAIQEVNVIMQPKVEYGWKPGAVINVGIKSGTNALHGTAYAFGNHDALNARNPFLLPTQPKQSVALKQFGSSVGGPIKKDKLFYFGNYEGQRYSVVSPRTAQAPTTQFIAGNTSSSLPAAIADLNSRAVPVNQLSLNLAGCTNNGLTNGSTITCNPANGIFGNSTSSSAIASNFPTTGGSDNFIIKLDYNLNDHNSLHGEYYYGDGNFDAQTGPLTQPYWRSDLHARSQVIRTVWAWIPNSAWVNEARFGFDRIAQWSLPGDCTPGVNGAPDYAAIGLVTGVTITPAACGLPPLTISGFTTMGTSNAGNLAGWYPQVVDSISYTRGNHVFKFGGELRLNHYNAENASGTKGTLSFGTTAAFIGATALEDFLAGINSNGTLIVGDPKRDISWQSYAGFVQDDWRVTPKVTLNLGLRYEVQTPIWHEVNHLLGNFDPTSATGLVQQSGGALSKTDFNNLAPRLGVAWDVTGKGTTVIRAGAGIYYTSDIAQWVFSAITPHTNPTGAQLFLANGTSVSGPGTMNNGNVAVTGSALTANWNVNTPIFGSLPQTGSTLKCGNGISPNPSPCNIGAVDPNIHGPYVTNWNLTIQHAFTTNLTWEIGYVGNHGTGLYFMQDVNQPTPGVRNTSGSPGSSLEQIRRPYYSQFPYLGQIKWLNNQDVSNFSGLQTTLSSRGWHGLTYTAAYSFGHALDEASLDGANNPQIIMDSRNPKLEYGNAQYDIRHRFTFTGTYLIPGRKAPAQLLEGWQLNTSISASGGLAMNAFDSTSDISGTGEKDDRWNLFGDAHDFWGYGGASAIPCYGITGSSFGKVSSCTIVAIPSGATTAAQRVTNMPAACITAASSLPTNPDVPTTDSRATGLGALASLGCYLAPGGAVIVPPAQGTFGNMGRYMLYGQGIRVWDLSVFKNTRITERLNTQFRAEVFNVLNSRQFAVPRPGQNQTNPNVPGTFGASNGTPDVVANSPVIGSGAPRKIQFGLKLIF
jgi:hypothetical protein